MDGGKLSAKELSELLERLGRDLKRLYGRRYQGLVLYGSYARGEADEGSDIDVLLLLEGSVAMGREIVRVEPILWPVSLETGYAISVPPVDVEAYLTPREPFLMNARKEGVLVA